MQSKPSNPFVEGINIPDEFFCDRQKETERIISILTNGGNVVLKSPRRIGKSSLINHIFMQKEIADNYNVMYVDLLGTSNATEFIREFQSVFTSKPFARTKTVKEILKSLPGKTTLEAGYNHILEHPTVKLKLESITEIEMTLEKIFSYLEGTKKPNIVVFDEFQQIKYYPESMAAILRSYVQWLNNTKFIFSGSSRRMLTTMFDSENEPFFHSATSVDLDLISEDKYREFCIGNFRKYNKDIEESAVQFAYYLTGGNTFEIQRIMHNVFLSTATGKVATEDDIKTAVNQILDTQDQTYREKLSRLNGMKERKVFLAIAVNGVASELMSQKMIRDYDLGAASSISQSLGNLCDEDRLNLVLRIGNSYKLQDKMFELWIAKLYGILELKFQTAKNQFEKEMTATKELKLPKFPKN